MSKKIIAKKNKDIILNTLKECYITLISTFGWKMLSSYCQHESLFPVFSVLSD